MKVLKSRKKVKLFKKIKRKALSEYGKDLVSLVVFGPCIKTDFEDEELYLIIVSKNSKKKLEFKIPPYKIFTIHKKPEAIKTKNLWLKGTRLKILYDKGKFFEEIMKGL